MIRILNVASSPHAIGGVEYLLVRTAAELDPKRFDVRYCNLFFDESTLVSALRERGAEVTAIGGSGVLQVPRIFFALKSEIARGEYDIVHTHMLHATILGQGAAAAARAPVRIVTRHYTDGHLSRARRTADRIATRSATIVIAVSQAVRQNLLDAGVADRRIRVIHNGVDLAALDAATVDGTLPWPEEWRDALLIACTGNFIAYKGHRVLLHAFQQIVRNRPDARLVLIGEGPEREALQQLANTLGIAQYVVMPGSREDVPALLRHCRLYVQPSLVESFGIAAAEAMASRLPVVAARVGGLPELVDDQSGVLVPPGDADALAKAVLALAADPSRACELGNAGRARVESEFTLQRHVARTAAVYEEAVSSR
ncbi:MAG TPA: glycosyltransferase [Thermoanaerobaculia bacterium]|nr:glycosyltransferase [Thermoanaerobaculia bacterium]